MFEISDFKVGDRVELHPATDLWMRGARFGTVATVSHSRVGVQLDRGSHVTLRARDIAEINPL